MIKIFTGLPEVIEKKVNAFLTKDIQIISTNISESQGNEGYGINMLVQYTTINEEVYTIDEIERKVEEILSSKIQEIIKEDKENLEDELKNYEEYLDTVFKDLLYADKHKELYNEYIEFMLYCQKHKLEVNTPLLGYWNLKRRNKWETHFNLYYKKEVQ